MSTGPSRRSLLRGAASAATGAAAALVAGRAPGWLGPDRLPLDGGYAPAGNELGWNPRGAVATVWHGDPMRNQVALTFDDGPEPDWTPRVLDVLDRLDAVATFFVVGERLLRHSALIRGRYDRHEVGDHTFAHRDLAKRDEAAVRSQLVRCREAIMTVTGKTPTMMRPPWGHLGGTTLAVAEELSYDIVMWSRLMPENRHGRRPTGIVEDVVGRTRPGEIILAHDVGDPRRLVVIDNLEAIITGLRGRGLELVTVSTLIRASASTSMI